MVKVLITGVNGFIGKGIAKKLIEEGHSVSGLGIEKYPCIKMDNYFSGDILDEEIVKKAMEGVEVVVHLAALTAHKDIVENKNNALLINFLGTKNVLEAFCDSPSAKKFIYASTGKVYGKIKSLPITEEHPANPLNVLGKSKLITERLIDFYANKEKSFVIYRIFNVFGDNQNPNFLFPTLLSQLKHSDRLILGDIKSKRDYVHIDDVVRAFLLGIKTDLSSGSSIFNICSGKAISVEEIVKIISKIKNKTIEIEVDAKKIRQDEEDVEYGSFEKAKNILGWKPCKSIEEYLRETL